VVFVLIIDIINCSIDIFFFVSRQTYAVDVSKSCVGRKCFEGTSFQALVDSGTSFTSLPQDIYEAVTSHNGGEFISDLMVL
jgi:hypothetical protein